ncbi:RluA family pseudouridine synthase [bacterium]|nr:MAG: RluA family pseudouridine synthase [bacterium]
MEPGTERISVDDAAAGERLDRWLQSLGLGPTRSHWQRLIEQGQITVDGQVRPARYRLKGGESVIVVIGEPESTELLPDPDVEFELLYVDDDMAIVNKPPGLVVHPSAGHRDGTLVNGLLARLDTLSGVGGRARPGLVHRLDKDTSGLLVVARNDHAHQALAAQLADRSLVRIYRAICLGAPQPEAGEIDLPLDRDPRDRKRRAVVRGGRQATTDYKVEALGQGSALLRLRLRTGRTHQIRVHLAHKGHPVLGDTLYGGTPKRIDGAHPEHRAALKRALRAIGRQALHAWELRLIHPGSGEQMSFQAPVPDDFRAAWERLKPEDEAD